MYYIFSEDIDKEKYNLYFSKNYEKKSNKYDNDLLQLNTYLSIFKEDHLKYIYLYAFNFYYFYKNNKMESCIIIKYLKEYSILNSNNLLGGCDLEKININLNKIIKDLEEEKSVSIFNITDLHVLNKYTNYVKFNKN